MPRKTKDVWKPWRVNGRVVGFIRCGTYYIFRTLAGHRVRLSTGCVTLDAANAEYQKFELNPGAYVSRLGRRAFGKKRVRVGAANPERAAQIRDNHLARQYRITPERFAALMVEQGGRCAICGCDPSTTRHGVLDVDHCHRSGNVRGLLCNDCNRGIGSLGESASLLRKAAAYLEERGPEVGPAAIPEKRAGDPE